MGVLAKAHFISLWGQLFKDQPQSGGFRVEKGHTVVYNAAREQSHPGQGFLRTLGPVSGDTVGMCCHLVVASVVCIVRLIQVYFMWLLPPSKEHTHLFRLRKLGGIIP